MIYKFFLCSEELDDFYRELRIDADCTFLDLHKLILKSVGYADDQITSFFVCDDAWERELEIGLVDMGMSCDEDLLLMEEVVLRDQLSGEGQKLQYVFDNISDRAFFLELKEVITREHIEEGEVTRSKGNPPTQLAPLDDMSMDTSGVSLGDDFYGSDSFNEDELDADGFSDMNFDDSNF